MPDINNLKNYLLIGAAVFLSITIFACLLRAILGPRFTDRIIAANIIGTKTIALISNICLIYAIISFLSVVVLARSVIEQKHKSGGSNNINNNSHSADDLRSMIQQIWREPFNYIFEEQ